jgi:hypothetical protein
MGKLVPGNVLINLSGAAILKASFDKKKAKGQGNVKDGLLWDVKGMRTSTSSEPARLRKKGKRTG